MALRIEKFRKKEYNICIVSDIVKICIQTKQPIKWRIVVRSENIVIIGGVFLFIVG